VFSTYSDDGVRVWIDGRLVVSNWSIHNLTYNSGYISLTAGQQYTIKVEYFQSTASASLQLFWQSARQVKEIIPTGSLVPTRSYYVSALGSDDNDGLSTQRPFRSLARVNGVALNAGDSVSLRRGHKFPGSFIPTGSGIVRVPIKLNAYGTGLRPIISAGSAEAAIKLFNQQHWEISGVETTGGTRFGIYVGGDLEYQTLKHIYIQDVVVRDVKTLGKPQYDAGLIVVMPSGNHLTFADVQISKVTAYNTNQWWGIHVGFNNWYGYKSASYPRTNGVKILGSKVHSCGGDLITVAASTNVLIDGNVAYNGGLALAGSTTGMYTPAAVWTWASSNVVVQNNEVYNMHTYGKDGAAFDADWGSTNVTIQYNYAHDNEGPCVMVLSLNGFVTTNTVVRYNICSYNVRRLRPDNSEIYLYSANPLNGVQVYNNTIYHAPLDSTPAVYIPNFSKTGTLPYLFKNNIVYSEGPNLVTLPSAFESDNNIYWHTGASSLVWNYGGVSYYDLSSFNVATSQDVYSFHSDPVVSSPTYHAVGRPKSAFQMQYGSPAIGQGATLTNMGSRDFFGTPLPASGPVSIGADGTY
jgi:hypothetical protein